MAGNATQFDGDLVPVAVRVPQDAKEVIEDLCVSNGVTLGALVEAWAELVASGDYDEPEDNPFLAAAVPIARQIDQERRGRRRRRTA